MQKGFVPRSEDLYIGSAPAEEDCAQVGAEGYSERARAECRALVGQIRRMFGHEPHGTRLYVRQNPHDFGTYLSVNCSYPDEQGATYAYRCEAELPTQWDTDARLELGLDRSPAPQGFGGAKARAATPPGRDRTEKGGSGQ